MGGLILAGIGFTGSYRALLKLGQKHGLGDFAYAFPVGVDVGIVVLYAVDLYLTRRRIRWPLVRLVAHGFTAATVVFNVASSGRPWREDLVGAGLHAVIPIMFVIAVEAARRVVIRVTQLEDGAPADGRDRVPLTRWALAPASSFAVWRSMVLHNVRSYPEAVGRRVDQLVYRTLLDRAYPKGKQYPRGWRSAPMEDRLPLIMAPYGLTVDEALAIPEQQAEAERQQAEAQRERERQEKRAAEIEAKEARIRELEDEADIAEREQAAQARITVATVAARSSSSRASALADVEERAVIREAEAVESAETAAALERAATARRAAAAADEAAAAIEEEAAERRRKAALADQEAAAALARAGRDQEQAALAEQRAAEALRRAAEAQAHAVATESRLTDEQRAAAAAALENGRALEESALAEQRAAETRAAAAATDARAAATEEATAVTRERAAARDARAALDQERAAVAARNAETALRHAAEARAAAAEAEAAAVKAEDYARLTPQERDTRRVARMILVQGDGVPDNVELSLIADTLGVSVSTASNRRREAADLLAQGYRPPQYLSETPNSPLATALTR
ncbi:DUF2637 domain-containing protein [Streptomyces bauhiniae]|uniref:DUF2637 domain-containing protein n=1 Tax=Streptomyces bauhiniae TaxID=2340725 RepID=UPI003323D286